jgi:hypothetical protein
MPFLTSLAATAAKTASKPAGVALQAGRRIVRLPGSKPKRIITTGRAALAGGVAAGAAGLLLRRRGSRSKPPEAPSSVPEVASTMPGVSNYDASGPPSNTSTPIPAVDASAEPLGIDEDAEVAAAQAEAANIGGPEIDYAAAEPDMTAGDAEAVVFEGGGGESEGFEQADADLVDTATSDVGPGSGTTPAEARIEEAIEGTDDPGGGETPEPVTPPSDGRAAAEDR